MDVVRQKDRKQIIAIDSSIGPDALNMVIENGTATVNIILVLMFPAAAYANRQSDPALRQIEQSYDIYYNSKRCL